MRAGDAVDIPALEVPPTLRVGNSGAIYFAMGTDCYGPVGASGVVTASLAVERGKLTASLPMVDPQDADEALNQMYASLTNQDLPKLPCQTN